MLSEHAQHAVLPATLAGGIGVVESPNAVAASLVATTDATGSCTVAPNPVDSLSSTS